MSITPRRSLAKLAVVCIALLSLQSAAAARPRAAVLPGWKTLMSSNWTVKNPSVENWRGMLARWSDGKACESETCTIKGWAEMVAQVKAAGDLLARVKLANALIDDPTHHPYIQDKNNWGQSEYWETPYQFLKKSGSVHDFAIAKYFLLKAAGVPVADMQVIVVRLKAAGNHGHVILTVNLGNGHTVVLDNLVSRVFDATLVKGEYTPYIGINEDNWWLYTGAL